MCVDCVVVVVLVNQYVGYVFVEVGQVGCFVFVGELGGLQLYWVGYVFVVQCLDFGLWFQMVCDFFQCIWLFGFVFLWCGWFVGDVEYGVGGLYCIVDVVVYFGFVVFDVWYVQQYE